MREIRGEITCISHGLPFSLSKVHGHMFYCVYFCVMCMIHVIICNTGTVHNIPSVVNIFLFCLILLYVSITGYFLVLESIRLL